MALLDDENDPAKHVPPERQLNAAPFPRMHDHHLQHLSNSQFRTIEVKENEFADFILIQDGKVVAEAKHPDAIWIAYRKLMIEGIQSPSPGEVLLAHSLGVRLDSGVGQSWTEETEGVREAREDYRGRFFATYTLKGK